MERREEGDKRLYFRVEGVVFKPFTFNDNTEKVWHRMTSMIREIALENGLTVRFFDHIRHYYGDFYLVKIEIACEVPLQSGCFGEPTDLEEARRLVGDPAVYRRFVEQMGVPSTAIATVTERLMGNFIDHSLPYFSSTGFPGRFLKAELERVRRKNMLPSRVTAYHHD